ncbi:NUDIX domain-containing protein [Streptomyces sp. NPDC050610]|uniref:NUDIX domain-containing protein n=1 Tax=Streptomyces sp. NPDC050610 TaxID=3157097 RepID=UPI00342AD91F
MHDERAETATSRCQGLLLSARGAILLVRRTHRRDGDPRWYEAPGSPVRAGESVQQVLARVVREQTGLRVAKGKVGALLVDGPSHVYLVGPLRGASVIRLPRRSSSGGPPPFDHYVWALPAELNTYCALDTAQLLWAALRAVPGPTRGRASGRYGRAA